MQRYHCAERQAPFPKGRLLASPGCSGLTILEAESSGCSAPLSTSLDRWGIDCCRRCCNIDDGTFSKRPDY